MNSRRDFLQKLGILGVGASLEKYFILETKSFEKSSGTINWNAIRKQFPIKNYPYIHLNSGSAGVMPQPVQAALIDFIKTMNAQPPYEAWEEWASIRLANKQVLAKKLGVDASELAIVRNTTEGINNIVFGLNLKKGDEVIAATHDYPFVLNALHQRAEREGVVVKQLQLDLTTISDEALVEAYRSAMTPKTKVVYLTHLTHREGRILPIRQISAAARPKGIEVALDAAHSFAHIPFHIKDLGVDYLATSLHKWLNAPHGTGILYIQKEKIPKVYPLASAFAAREDFMDKFEHLGTRAFHQELGISAALAFQEEIGWERKQARLQVLKAYWTDAVKDLPKVHFATPLNAEQSCAIASFRIEGQKNVLQKLKKEYQIHAKSVAVSGKGYIRVTPNIFTLEKELDVLIHAIQELSK